jgi:hypothetical protein
LRDLGIAVIADMPGIGADLAGPSSGPHAIPLHRADHGMNDVINHWRHRYGAGLRYLPCRARGC